MRGNVLIAVALAACIPASASAHVTAGVLVFEGAGTSAGDRAAIEAILDDDHIGYARANSAELNAMPRSALSEYRLLIVPGGNFVDMGNSLTAATVANVRDAVKGGLNYFGICAGAFLAGYFPAPYRVFDLSSGVKFGFYSAEKRGVRKAAVRITTAAGPELDQYWEDGPELTGWGAVVGKYPDGTPAIVEGSVGRGWVILTGVHVEAPASWRRGMDFTTPVRDDSAYARTLVVAALNRTMLAHY